MKLDGTGDFTGTQATGAGVDSFGRTVHYRFNTFDIGFPSPVRPSVGVGNFNAESQTLSADITFCHTSAPPKAK